MSALNVCLVESFYGGSHRSWADGYAEHSSHEVRLLTLPAENWRWRMRGGAIELAEAAAALLASGFRPDVVIVSDLIDVALFRQLTHAAWGRLPTVVYFHENQMGYPSQKGTDVTFPWINVTSALTADQVWFNSHHHRASFINGIDELLRRFPDRPSGDLPTLIDAKSEVVNVGVRSEDLHARQGSGRAQILWNHRWEHDKRPERFIRAIDGLGGRDFEVVICGEPPISHDVAREEFIQRLGNRVVWAGRAPRPKYLELLESSDIVISTADQEFFGISVVEAMAAGCCPVLPHRLSYPELVPEALWAEVLYPGDDPGEMLARRIVDVDAARELGMQVSGEMEKFGWETLASVYDQRLCDLFVAE